jgi:hypothetical protein
MSSALRRAPAWSPASAWPELTLAVMSLGAAAIHFAVVGDHFDEWAVFGLFFAVVAWLQAAWALAVVVAGSRPLLVAGAVGNAIVAAVWVVSRTVGLPIGPEPGAPEAVSFIDVVSTVLEVLIVGLVVLLVARPSSTARLSGRAGLITAAALSLLVVPVTTIAMATAIGHGHHAAASHEHHEHESESNAQTVGLGGGHTLEVIVDSLEPPTYQVHLTFNSEGGNELDVASASVRATSAGGERLKPSITRLGPGHFVANVALDPGEWTFNVVAETKDGESLRGSFESHVGHA